MKLSRKSPLNQFLLHLCVILGKIKYCTASNAIKTESNEGGITGYDIIIVVFLFQRIAIVIEFVQCVAMDRQGKCTLYSSRK